jgi:hypothetical protein
MERYPRTRLVKMITDKVKEKRGEAASLPSWLVRAKV